MKLLARLLVVGICACTLCVRPAAAQRDQRSSVPAALLTAGTAAVDCDACPRALAQAGSLAMQILLSWNRFRIVENRAKADVIILISGNPYLGDYLTRDGPDNRPVFIDGVILTVIDPHNGQVLWADSRRWGSWRIVDATKDLFYELRLDLDSQVKRWTMKDVLSCIGAMAYQPFAFATPEELLAKHVAGIDRIASMPDRLAVTEPDAPDFCRRVQLVVGPDGKITGFEVQTSQAETLDLGDVLEQADRFEFTSGRDAQSQTVHFAAQSKDKKVLIEYDVQGRQTVLSRVRYLY